MFFKEMLLIILGLSVGVFSGWFLFNWKARQKNTGDDVYKQALLNAIPDMVFILNANGIYVDYIPAVDQQPFLPPEKFLNKNVREVLPGDVAEKVLSVIHQVLENRDLDWIDYSLDVGDEIRDYEMRGVYLRDDRVLCLVRDITDHKRVLSFIRSRANELSTLHEVALEITGYRDLNEFLAYVIKQAVTLLDSKAGCVYLKNERTGELDCQFQHSVPGEIPASLKWSMEKMSQRVAQKQQTRVEHVQAGRDLGQVLLLSAPIIWEGKTIGVMTISGCNDGIETGDQKLEILGMLASLVAVTLQNIRYYNLKEEQLLVSETLQKLGTLLASKDNLNEVLEKVLSLLGHVVDYDSVSIHLIKGENLQISISRGFDNAPGLEQLVHAHKEDILTDELMEKKVIYIPDTQNSADWFEFPGTSHIRSWIGAVLETRGEIIGILNVDSNFPNAFDGTSVNTVKSFADQAAAAIENARLFDALRVEHNRLQTLYQLNNRLTKSLDVDQIIKQSVRLVHQEFKAKKSEFFLYDSESHHLYLSFTIGRTEHEVSILKQSLDQLSKNSILSRLIHDLQPVRIDNITENEEWVDIPELDQDMHSLITVPVFTGEDIVGALSIMHSGIAYFSDEDEDLMMNIAQQVGLALNNAYKFSRVDALLSELREEEDIQKNILQHLPMGVLLLDADHKIVSFNVLGEKLIHEVEPEFDDGTLIRIGDIRISRLILYTDDPRPFELQIEDETRKTYEVQIRRVSTREEKQWLLLIEDVTDGRKAQEQLRMQERLATIGRFAAGIAHDFNNIMSAITVYTDVLGRSLDLSPKNQEQLEVIKNQTGRANQLIRQILDFSRQTDIEHTPMDLLDFVREVLHILERVFPGNIEISLEYQEENSYPISGDQTRLQQMLLNLAGNARDAMPDGGKLTIRLSRIVIEDGDSLPVQSMPTGRWIKLEMEDTGVGIPGELHQKIFEPFYTTKKKDQGTGLGLSQVYGIVKNHQGFIKLDSEPDQGAAFIIYLPVMEQTLDHPVEETENQSVNGQGKLALVVEDDRVIREALWAILEEYNFQIITASNGVQALDIFEQIGDQISFIITDIVMPKMDGIQLYDRVQSLSANQKFLFITGHPLNQKRQEILERHDIQWLRKPFSMNEFIDTLQKIIHG